MKKNIFAVPSKPHRIILSLLAVLFVFSAFLISEKNPVYAAAYAPEAPSGVTAEAEDSSRIRISWNTDFEADLVQVWRTNKADAEQKDYVCIGIYKANAGQCVSKLLSANTTYYYKLRAYNKDGGKDYYSGYSPVISAKTKELPAPYGIKTEALSHTQIQVNWTSPENADFIQVWRASKANAEQKDFVCIGIYNAGDGQCVSKLLKPNTTYYYKVRAYQKRNGKTVYSAYSPVVSRKTQPVPGPDGVTAEALSSSMVRLSWTPYDEVDFVQVWRTAVPDAEQKDYVCIGVYNVSDGTAVSKRLERGTTYYYKLRGYKKADGKTTYSAYSQIVSVQTNAGRTVDGKIEILDEYYSYTDYTLEHYFVVKNISGKILNVSTDSKAYDASGNQLGSDSGYYWYLGPDAVGCFSEFYGSDDARQIADVRTNFTVTENTNSAVKSGVENISLKTARTSDGCIVTAKNNGTETMDALNVHVIFFNKGEVVGSDLRYLTDIYYQIRPGKEMTKKFSCSSAFDYMEVYYGGGRIKAAE